MDSWTPIASSVVGGLMVVAGVALTQAWTQRRDNEARLWSRRADACVALLRWRLEPPDDTQIPNPIRLQEATEQWKSRAYPLLAELSLFGGSRLQGVLRAHPYLFQAVDAFAQMPPGDVAALVRDDLAGRTRQKA